MGQSHDRERNPAQAGPEPAALARLGPQILAHAPYDGVFDLRVPGVHVSRFSQPMREWRHAVLKPALCLVAQGAKKVLLGTEVYPYDAARMLVYSVDVPVSAQITQASLAAPFLGVRLDLDPARIADLSARVYPEGLPRRTETRAVCVGEADGPVLDTVVRLLGLASHPEDAELLAPLVMDELLIRLLRSPLGLRVAMIGQEDSAIHRLLKAIAWIREHYDHPLDVARMAALVAMSPSSFHAHFKAVTALSPLQYQKALRLQEARRLMLQTRLDAASAARRVGYQSPSQFSREYGRLFGAPPTRDVAVLREQAESAAAVPEA